MLFDDWHLHAAIFSLAEKEHEKDRKDNFKFPLICQAKLESSYYQVDFFFKKLGVKRRLQTS